MELITECITGYWWGRGTVYRVPNGLLVEVVERFTEFITVIGGGRGTV